MKYSLSTMKKIMRIQFLFFLILMSGCTDIIQILDESTRDEILVVEGGITDRPGPYTVILSTTTTVGGLGSNKLGRGANVIVEESTGTEEILREVRPGVYQTQVGGIQGKVGNSYKVKITLANGEEYESTFDSIPEPVEMTSLNAEFIDERFTVNGLPRRTIGHTLSAQLKKEPSVQKFFQFKVVGIQESEISIEPILCPAPTPSTTICYAIKNPLQSKVSIFNDSNIAKASYSVDITIIPIEQKRRYLANVEVHSFSSEAYNFWSAVQDQLETKGNIFDSPIPPVIGNVKNITTGTFAQGHFTMTAISRDNICIDRSNISITSSIPLACAGSNCIQIYAPAFYTMPDFGFCQ